MEMTKSFMYSLWLFLGLYEGNQMRVSNKNYANFATHELTYEGESVNRTHIHIKRKECDIRTRKKDLFLDISSTNTDTLVLLLYQCVETRIIESVDLSQPLPHMVEHHLRLSNVLERIYWPICEPLYTTNTSHRETGNISLWVSFALSILFTRRKRKRTLFFGSTLLKNGRHFDY
jgi:hypothetical protein